MAGDRHRSRDFGTDPDFPYRDEDDRHPGDDYRRRPQSARDPRPGEPHRGRDRWSEVERSRARGRTDIYEDEGADDTVPLHDPRRHYWPEDRGQREDFNMMMAGGYGVPFGLRSRGAARGGYGQDPDYPHRGRHPGERPARGGRGRPDDRYDDRGMLDRAADEVSSWFGDDEATRRREEDHRGKGPRGYQRSDQRIEEDCNDRLTDDPFVDARDIQVSVSNGEITLSGEVDSKRAKRHAEDCADSVSGVTHVQNNLRIRQPDQTAGQTPTSAGSPSSTPSSGGNTI